MTAHAHGWILETIFFTQLNPTQFTSSWYFYLFASFLIILERFINFIGITIIIIGHDKIDFDMVR